MSDLHEPFDEVGDFDWKKYIQSIPQWEPSVDYTQSDLRFEAMKVQPYRSSIEVYQIKDEDGSMIGFIKFIIEGDDIFMKSFS